MRNPKKHALAMAVAVSMALPSVAMATNGYFANGYGVKSKGMAGAGVAMPLDAMDATINPANMVNVGSRIDAGLSWFSPRRSYTTSVPNPQLPQNAFQLVPGTYDSDNENFFIPNFGWNHMIDDVSSDGITLAGNGGMNTEYSNVPAPFPGGPTGTFYGGTAGVDLLQLATMVTYARKVTEQVSLGITGIYAFARFKATGLGAFGAQGFSNDPANLTNNGYDTAGGFGVKVGITGDINDMFSLGASYQSKINMDEFDKYKGLFAEEGDFDIPSTWSLGAKISPAAGHSILLDYQRIDYTDVAAISNPVQNFFNPGCGMPPVRSGCLGGSNGAGFGWEDLNVYRIGYQYDAGNWQARAGFSTNDQAIPESQTMFNIIAPGVVKNHWTAGFTTNVSKNSSLDFSFSYAPSVKITGDHPFAGASQQISIEMEQYELGANYTWRY